MRSFIRGVEGIARILTGLSFMVIILAVILQILGRSGWVPTFIWTEEISRFALLYLVAFGVGLSLISGDLVNVDLISESLPGRAPWVLRLVAAVATLGLCLTLIDPAWFFTSIGARQTAPASQIRMDWVNATVLVLPVTLGLFAALRILGMLTGRDSGRPEHFEQEHVSEHAGGGR